MMIYAVLYSNHIEVAAYENHDIIRVYKGKDSDPDILTVCMYGGKMDFCDEVAFESRAYYKPGDKLISKVNKRQIEIIDIVADQYKYDDGSELESYEFFEALEWEFMKKEN